MEITLLFIVMVLGHWLGDFIFQTDEMAISKHKDLNDLCIHSLTYSSVWVVIGLIMMSFELIETKPIALFLFFGITTITHALVDHLVSKFGYKFFESGNPSTFMGIMSFDQMLHYIQLYLTYTLLF